MADTDPHNRIPLEETLACIDLDKVSKAPRRQGRGWDRRMVLTAGASALGGGLLGHFYVLLSEARTGAQVYASGYEAGLKAVGSETERKIRAGKEETAAIGQEAQQIAVLLNSHESVPNVPILRGTLSVESSPGAPPTSIRNPILLGVLDPLADNRPNKYRLAPTSQWGSLGEIADCITLTPMGALGPFIPDDPIRPISLVTASREQGMQVRGRDAGGQDIGLLGI